MSRPLSCSAGDRWDVFSLTDPRDPNIKKSSDILQNLLVCFPFIIQSGSEVYLGEIPSHSPRRLVKKMLKVKNGIRLV